MVDNRRVFLAISRQFQGHLPTSFGRSCLSVLSL